MPQKRIIGTIERMSTSGSDMYQPIGMVFFEFAALNVIIIKYSREKRFHLKTSEWYAR
jgi:hypothetical protein